MKEGGAIREPVAGGQGCGENRQEHVNPFEVGVHPLQHLVDRLGLSISQRGVKYAMDQVHCVLSSADVFEGSGIGKGRLKRQCIRPCASVLRLFAHQR